jgi:hypothetical protein
MRANDKTKEASVLFEVLPAAITFILIPGMTLAACLGALGWQIFSYLRSGFWQPISSIDFLSFIFQNTEFGLWFKNPYSWYGVYELLNWLPLLLGIVLTGVIIEIFWLPFFCALISAAENKVFQPTQTSNSPPKNSSKSKKKTPDWVYSASGILIALAIMVGITFVLSFLGVAI